MISDDDATVTVSLRPPTSSFALIAAPCTAVSTTSFATKVLNPSIVIVTS